MLFKVKDWAFLPQDEADIRTVSFVLSVDGNEDDVRIASVSLSGSLIIEIPDYLNAGINSQEFPLQMGRLAIALLNRELVFNKSEIFKKEFHFGFLTEDFPHGAVDIPDIDQLEGYTFEIK